MDSSLFNFPIRSSVKAPQWPVDQDYDDIFEGFMNVSIADNSTSWPADEPTPSTFDELFPDLADLSPAVGQSYGSPNLGLLTEPYPFLSNRNIFHEEVGRTPANGHVQQATQPMALPARDYDPVDSHARSYERGQAASPTRREESRGRTQTTTPRGSSRRTRNPSGVRKTLRHARSTPNMISPSKGRHNIPDDFLLYATDAPPMPNIDPVWSAELPLSSPVSAQGRCEPDVGYWPQSRLDAAIDPALANMMSIHGPYEFPHAEFLTPRASPLEDRTFYQRQPDSTEYPLQRGNPLRPAFNANFGFGPNVRTYDNAGTIHAPRLPRINGGHINHMKSRSFTPAPLAFDKATFHADDYPSMLSAPLARGQGFDFGFDDDLHTSRSIPNSRARIADCISPKTTFFPSSATHNFSLPYRSSSPREQPATISIPPSRATRSTSAAPRSTTEPAQESQRRNLRSSSRIRNHHRSKSGPGPDQSAPKTRSRSRRRGGKKDAPSTSVAGAGGTNPGGSCFVNFTADDSHQLLSGVAPSGSSKTKARREQEAQERRRKLSRAAVKAVEEGDLKALEEAGLLFE